MSPDLRSQGNMLVCVGDILFQSHLVCAKICFKINFCLYIVHFWDVCKWFEFSNYLFSGNRNS